MTADPSTPGREPLLVVEGLVKHFPAKGGRIVHAVEGVDLTIGRGRIVELVGESGSGKTTVKRTIRRLTEQTFTLQGLKWRVEAWRSGLSVAEVAMRLGRLDSQRYFRAASSSSRIFMP